MKFAIIILLLGFYSNADELDCVYTLKYQVSPNNPKFIEALRDAHFRALKYCNGKNPCSPEGASATDYRVTYNNSDPSNSGQPSRKFEEGKISKIKCAKNAEAVCRVERAGTLTSNTVDAYFQGEHLFTKVCKEGGIMETIHIKDTPANSIIPTSIKTKKNEGATQ